MANRVYVIFDPSTDPDCMEQLLSWDAGGNWEFVCPDPVGPVDADSVGPIHAQRRELIEGARYALVLIGAEANKRRADHTHIGKRNWMNWEIAESIATRTRIAAVKLDWHNTAPDELAGTHASWARGFREEPIFTALENA